MQKEVKNTDNKSVLALIESSMEKSSKGHKKISEHLLKITSRRHI